MRRWRGGEGGKGEGGGEGGSDWPRDPRVCGTSRVYLRPPLLASRSWYRREPWLRQGGFALVQTRMRLCPAVTCELRPLGLFLEPPHCPPHALGPLRRGSLFLSRRLGTQVSRRSLARFACSRRRGCRRSVRRRLRCSTSRRSPPLAPSSHRALRSGSAPTRGHASTSVTHF